MNWLFIRIDTTNLMAEENIVCMGGTGKLMVFATRTRNIRMIALKARLRMRALASCAALLLIVQILSKRPIRSECRKI